MIHVFSVCRTSVSAWPDHNNARLPQLSRPGSDSGVPVSRHDSRVLCPDTIHVFCVQTRFTCLVSRHDSRVLCADMIHLFNCPDNALIMVTQYILNTSAEADGLVRSTKRNRRHEKAGEVGTINIQETQIAKLIQCQRMALPQQCLAASTVQTRLGFRCSSVQTRFTCFVSRHDSRVLCPDMIHVCCVQTQFTCVVSRHNSRVLCPDMIHVFCVQT